MSAAFKSTSRRGSATEPKAPPPAAASRRRSHSVSAVSRKTHIPFDDKSPISTEFSNSRDNPLFWSRSSSPRDEEENGRINETAASGKKLSPNLGARSGNGSSNSTNEQRGRSVTRSLGNKNGIGRSLSRVRGRSVSAAPRTGAYESEKEHDRTASTISQSRNNSKRISNSSISRTDSVRNRASNNGQAKQGGVRKIKKQSTEWSEDDSACSLQISNLEDGISVGSFSEAEEKTIIAAFEEWSGFRRNNSNKAAAAQVTDMPRDLLHPEAIELIPEIRREYSIKLEESEERARKLREDLAIEERRGHELDRILKDIIHDAKTSDMQKSRRGRRTSNERKRMSKRLTEEAMAYFDECVSLSTFDSSDFSASEDPAYSLMEAAEPLVASSLVPTTLCCYDQPKKTFGDSGVSAKSSSCQVYQFSFADKPEEDMRSYIKNFERERHRDMDMEASYSYFDAEEYTNIEGLLFDRVICNARIKSGGLLLCAGAFSSLPFI